MAKLSELIGWILAFGVVVMFCFAITSCTVKVGTVTLPGCGGTVGNAINQSDQADVKTDASIPVTGQGASTSN
jgi:hypothetical protein